MSDAPQTRRCHCGQPIGPDERWCSHACFLAEDTPERDD